VCDGELSTPHRIAKVEGVAGVVIFVQHEGPPFRGASSSRWMRLWWPGFLPPVLSVLLCLTNPPFMWSEFFPPGATLVVWLLSMIFRSVRRVCGLTVHPPSHCVSRRCRRCCHCCSARRTPPFRGASSSRWARLWWPGFQWRPVRDAYLTEGSQIGNGSVGGMRAGWARGTWGRVQPLSGTLCCSRVQPRVAACRDHMHGSCLSNLSVRTCC
jgi:hypothetical protein